MAAMIDEEENRRDATGAEKRFLNDNLALNLNPQKIKIKITSKSKKGVARLINSGSDASSAPQTTSGGRRGECREFFRRRDFSRRRRAFVYLQMYRCCCRGTSGRPGQGGCNASFPRSRGREISRRSRDAKFRRR